MIKYENQNGYIEITNNFAKLVGNAAQSCFGVTRMVSSNAMQSIKSVIKNKVERASDMDNSSQGITVKSVNGALVIDLNIAVSYGVNISAIANSIVNKVRYTIESATDLKVSEVNVHIEGIDSIN